MELPVTRYAKSGDVNVAYQLFGAGPRNIVLAPGFVSHVEHIWDYPDSEHLLTRLGGLGRTVIFDKRGTGMSDRTAAMPTLDERMDDIRAVMDAAGFDRAVLIGISEGGAMCQLFAATHPDRVAALVLIGTYGSYSEWVMSGERFKEFLETVDMHWGEGHSAQVFAPSLAQDAAFVRWWAKYERLGASPGAVKALMRMNAEIDVRAVMPSIQVPTFIWHRTGDRRVSVEAARYMARSIPNARLVERPGIDHLAFAGNVDQLLDDVEEFITGVRPAAPIERVLATVMFSDIVDSTKQAAALGDKAWAAKRTAHDQAVRAAIERQRGRVIKGLGDGFLATFDGPARAVQAALAAAQGAREVGLPIRIGLHCGEIALEGDDDISGLAVAVASRVAGLAQANEVLVSSTVRDLVAGSGLKFEDRGSQVLKGIDEPMRLYQAVG
jgi:class 3 adenylate cyclase